MLRVRTCLALGAALAVAPVHADTLDDVRAGAVTWLKQQRTLPGARMEARAVSLDSRLRLAPCGGPVAYSLPGNRAITARVSVVAHCDGPVAWTARVPVQVSMYAQVLVTNHPLARGDGLGAGDVHLEERDVASLAYGYISGLDDVGGRALARPLGAGTVLNPGMLAGRQAVRMGDSVSMEASVDGVVIRAEGIAMGAGDSGARVKVRNASSGKVLDGIVSGPGVVAILP
jgi:flagellar basal body P-ring formation protein FlgA